MSGYIKTTVGSEVPVEVWFEYEPEEAQTMDCPGSKAAVIIGGVYVDGDGEKDLLHALNDAELESLMSQCFEHVEKECCEHEL